MNTIFDMLQHMNMSDGEFSRQDSFCCEELDRMESTADKLTLIKMEEQNALITFLSASN